jgi:hypothetical protein
MLNQTMMVASFLRKDPNGKPERECMKENRLQKFESRP